MTNDSGFLTSHQSLSNYSTLANTIKSLSISGKTITYTKGDNTTGTLTTQDTTYSNFVKSGSGAKAGLVPAPSTTAGTTKYLREDGTWQVPPDHTYTVNNATLTIQKNGTTVKTFTANANSDVTCNITVPTKTSELTNNSGFLTSHQSLSNYSTLANTIKSLSISGKTITYTKGDNTTGTLTTQDNNTWTAMVGATSSSNGSVGYVNAVPPKDGYNTKYLRADGTWQVPPDHTYTVNNATLTIQKNGTNVATFTSNASSNVTANISVPTKVSQLTNDSGFITSSGSCNYANSAGSVAWSNVSGRPSSLVPVGSYIQFAGSQAPEGFLVCNGGAISRTTYSALFAVIGTKYGSGNGSTTFNLPNLTDRFLQGSTTSGTVKNAGLPNITGYIYSPAHSGTEQLGVFKVYNLDSNNYSSGQYYFWNWSFDASRSSSIYGNSSTVQPPALTCLICIKY